MEQPNVFRAWLQNFTARYPEFAKYIKSLPDEARFEYDVTRGEFIRKWSELFRDVGSGVMEDSLEAFTRGWVKKPGKPADYLQVLYQYALKKKKNRDKPLERPWWKAEEYNEEHWCGRCGGSGILLVWHPAVLNAVTSNRAAFLRGQGDWHVRVGCTCDNGRYAREVNASLATYHSDVFVIVAGETPLDQRKAVVECIEEDRWPEGRKHGGLLSSAKEVEDRDEVLQPERSGKSGGSNGVHEARQEWPRVYPDPVAGA